LERPVIGALGGLEAIFQALRLEERSSGLALIFAQPVGPDGGARTGSKKYR
jgi:hypothetical protein